MKDWEIKIAEHYKQMLLKNNISVGLNDERQNNFTPERIWQIPILAELHPILEEIIENHVP